MAKQTKKYSIGIDIGGTNIKAVLFDGKNILADYVLATPQDSLEHFLIMVQALISPLLDKARSDKIKISGIGVGAPGVIDCRKRKVLKATPNLLLIDKIELGDKIEEKTGYPVALDNDTNCFSLAESKIGSAKGYSNVYGVIIGTGIGGAWILNNKIYRGSHFGAGEPARIIMDFNDTASLEEIYQKLMQNNPANMAIEAYRGDILAEKVFQEFGRYLGIFFSNLVNLLDPEAIVLGGGTVKSSDLFLSVAKKIMQKYIMNPESKKVKILKSKLGDYAGAIGAALLVN